MTTTTPDDTRRVVRALRDRLRRVRRAGRTLLATRAVSWLCVAAMLAVAGLILVDMALRLPAGLRVVLLLGGLATLGVGVVRRLGPITRFKPPLPDVAMRVERWLAERGHDPRRPLSAGMGLPIDDPDPFTARLSRIVAVEAASGLRATPWGMLRWARPARALGAALLVAVAASVAINLSPSLATTGLARLFLPWSDAEWPNRTEIADATPGDPHPADTALAFRASLLRSPAAPGDATVTLSYRLITPGGEPRPVGTAVLVPQPTEAGAGDVYERLIEPAAWQTEGGVERWIEYWFVSGDDRTPAKRVRIVDPPALVGVESEIESPAYAHGLSGRFADAVRTSPGSADRRVLEAGPVLAGSKVSLTLRYNKPVSPRVDADGTTIAADTIDNEADAVRIGLRAEESGRLVLDAVDEFGLVTREPALLRLDVARDTPPEATVLEPSADEAVLETAIVPLTGEARDDLALTGLSLTYEIARADPGSMGVEPQTDPDAEPTVLASASAEPEPTKRVSAVLEITSLNARPGDEIIVHAVARDNFDLDGRTHGPVLSAPRRLRIIAPAEFVELVQSELEGVRRTAIRLDAQQEDLTRRTAQAAAAEDENQRAEQLEEQARAQAGLSQRLQAQTQMLERLAERLDRNALDDDALRALLDAAGEATDRAAQASERAAEEIAQQAGRAEPDERTAEEIEQAQEDVRDELARLINQLDRGQDDWAVRRNIEQMLSEQRELREATEQAGRRTVGRDLDALTPEERSELERIARRQEELARRAQDSIDELSERADTLRQQDPTQSAALDQAAEQAARDQLAEMLRQAGEQVGQNQTGAAGQMQEQSIEAMEEMLEQLENAQQNRDDALRRQLASLIESIESLVRQQQAALDALDGEAGRALELADRVRTNTLATEASAREGMSELARVGDLLVRAAEAQGDSVVALRSRPPETDAARAAETEALARLNEALEEARRQDQNAEQREQDRQRRELRDAYRAVVAEQAALRDQTADFAGQDLDRRQRAALRRVGQEQEALRVRIEAIPEEHGTGGIGVLELFHGRIDAALSDVVRSLGRGNADESVLAGQGRALALLRTILETLSEQPPKPEDPFDEGAAAGAGGGGGGGQQGQQPLIQNLEQLRLLRGLQAIVLESTRGGDEPAGLAELQRDIAEQTRELIRSMQQNGPPAQPATPQPIRPGSEPEQGGESDEAESDETETGTDEPAGGTP